MRKEKGPGACPAFFVGEEKGPPKKAALGWKQNKNSKPFDLLFLVQVTGLELARGVLHCRAIEGIWEEKCFL